MQPENPAPIPLSVALQAREEPALRLWALSALARARVAGETDPVVATLERPVCECSCTIAPVSDALPP